jgi:regulator of protease activity HflC (stomatin/prohibitin superfamily)
MLAEEEQALQLRYLQTLKEIANERSNTIVFPLPLDLLGPLTRIAKAASDRD